VTGLERRTRIRSVSKKRAAQNRTYLKRREAFLEANPLCAGADLNLPGVVCEGRSSTVQHAAGRRGQRLLDESLWIALCWPCHSWAELHPLEATGLRLRLPRVGRLPEDKGEVA